MKRKTLLLFPVMLLLIFTVFVMAGEKKKPVAPALLDSTTQWVKKADAIRFLEDKRQKMRESFATEDAIIQGQISILSQMKLDSIPLPK